MEPWEIIEKKNTGRKITDNEANPWDHFQNGVNKVLEIHAHGQREPNS